MQSTATQLHTKQDDVQGASCVMLPHWAAAMLVMVAGVCIHSVERPAAAINTSMQAHSYPAEIHSHT